MYRKIVAVSGPLEGTEYLLGRSTTIGRSGQIELQLLGKSVSRLHARLELADDGQTMRLKDLGSKNGTFVRGEPIDDVPIQHGQRFEIGNSSFLYEEFSAEPEAMSSEMPMLAVLGGRAEEVTSLFQSPIAPKPGHEPTIFPGSDEHFAVCEDPLHVTARDNGWAFCPVCGVKPS